jgi:hypothetical protein
MNLENPYQAFKLKGTFRPSFSRTHCLSVSPLSPSEATEDADIVLVFVGNPTAWETEGNSTILPGEDFVPF